MGKVEAIRNTLVSKGVRAVGGFMLGLALSACGGESDTVGKVPSVESCETQRPAVGPHEGMPEKEEKEAIQAKISYLACRAAMNAAEGIVNPTVDTDQHNLSKTEGVCYMTTHSDDTQGIHSYRAKFDKNEEGKTDLSAPTQVSVYFSEGGGPINLSNFDGMWHVSSTDTDNSPLYYPQERFDSPIGEWRIADEEATSMLSGDFGQIPGPEPSAPLPTTVTSTPR